MFKLLMCFCEKRKEDEESNVFMNSHFTIFMSSQRKRFFSFYLLEWLLKAVESALNQLLIAKLVSLGLLYCYISIFNTSTCSQVVSFPICCTNFIFIQYQIHTVIIFFPMILSAIYCLQLTPSSCI